MALTNSSFLGDDDHDTWCLLSSGEDDADLTGVGQRFHQDQSHSSYSEYWERLCGNAKALGFDIQQQMMASTLSQPLAQSTSSSSIPVAFETTSGKKHVDSLCKLIQVDSLECVKLTFGALKDINTDHHLQSLLGSRSLFLKVLLHYCQQRSARLGIVVELLRGNSNDVILNELDSQLLLNGAQRGMFKMLISRACSPNCPPTRDQVLPLKDIGDEFFIQQALQILSDQRLFEREQALEALLALFYARLSATCVDFTLMVLAMQSYGEFFTGSIGGPRLAQLSGLLCAEAVNLNTAGPSHIMMSPDAPLDLLTNVVMNFYDQVDRRRMKNTSTAIVAAPESIVMLSLGLLLKVCEHDDAMQCLQLANDCGAFDYLQFCFDTLLPAQTSFDLGVYQDTPGYDWQFSNSTPTLALEGETQLPDMAPNFVVYTSIGLELLNSVVFALGEYMKSPENLTVLCNLGTTLFANQPVLCDEFWRQPGWIGTLVETSIDETVTAWKLLASLCCDRTSVNRIMAMIPPETLPTLLSTADDDAAVVLKAVSKMAQYNPSAIRHALLDDLGVLFRILSVHPSQNAVLEPILNLLAAGLRDCPPWAKTAVQFFGARSSRDLLSACFASATTVGPAARVLQALVEVMSVVCFSSSDHDVLEYLSVTVKASIAGCQSLTSIFAFSSKLTVSYTHAYLILKATSELVITLRQLSLHSSIKVREVALEARATMLELFSTSTSLGLALAYFAGAPVSLSIGLLLEEMVEEAKLLQGATDEYAVDDASNPMGKWHGVLQNTNESPIFKLIQERLGDIESVRLDMSAVQNRNWSDGESAPLFAASAAIALFKTWAVEAEDFLLTQMVPRDFLENASPHRLLMSAATMPPVVRSDARLAHLWPACGLRTCDLLVHLVANAEVNGLDLPSHDSLALLSIVTAHAKSCGGLAPKVFDVKGILYEAMRGAISDVSDFLCGTSDGGEVDIQKGILFVKLLSSIVAVDSTRGVSLLEHDTNALVAALVNAVKAVNSASNSDKRERFAAECLRVLRSANMTNEVLPVLVEIANYSGQPSTIRTDLVAQALEILAQSISSGGDVSRVQTLMVDASFHERHVPEFRDSVLAMRGAVAKFLSLTFSSSKASMNLSDPVLMLQVFPTGETRLLRDLVGLNPYDIKSAATMLYLQTKEDADASQMASAAENLFLSSVFVDKHVSAVAAWSVLVQTWTSSGGDASLSLLNEIRVGLIDTMHELAQLKTEVEKEASTLSSKIDAVLDVTSELLLNLISRCPADARLERIELRKLVDTMEAFTPMAGFLSGRCALLTNLLATTAVVVQHSSTKIDSARFVPILRQGLGIGNDSSTIRASLLLLSSIIGSQELAEERKARESFANALSEAGLVRVLVDEVSRACTSSIKSSEGFDDEQVTAVMSLVTVLLALANLGEKAASLIPLFMESSLPKMFLSNAMFAQAIPRWTTGGGDTHYRGYIKSTSKISNDGGMGRVSIFLAGSSDPVHKVWRLCMRLLTTLLRFSSIHGQGRTFQQLAHTFVVEYDGILRSCLAQCSAVGVNSVLTRNLVDEGDEILALFSELGTKCDRFVDVTVMVVASLGKFLGSIGTSRFLFNLVRDVEGANQEQDSPFDNLQELHPSLSGGIGNARFEAIRYAHYARSAYAMVTGEDNLAFSSVGGQAPSGSELEATCYNAINNEFCAQLQVQVAHCLTNASIFLSKIHPASRCFTRFTKEERRLLNAFNIVKNGAIIAAHSPTGLTFARVITTDTVHRAWKCKTLDPDNNETSADVTIPIDDLAGVEDVMKRQNFFRFLSAPDSATHMETGDYNKSANIGHLILVLQWCRQGGMGVDLEIRTHLAESAAALLATEMSLHREIGTDKVASEPVFKNVNDQIFDLFDSSSKFPDLNNCLGPAFLQRIRAQLKAPLERARKDRAEKRRIYEERLASISASISWR